MHKSNKKKKLKKTPKKNACNGRKYQKTLHLCSMQTTLNPKTMNKIENLIYAITSNDAPISDLVGLYLNRYSYSDVNPIGRVTRVIGKSTIEVAIVRPTTEWPVNKADLVFVPGGFSATCINQHAQRWEFAETGETITLRVSKRMQRTIIPAEQPVKYYDYNF